MRTPFRIKSTENTSLTRELIDFIGSPVCAFQSRMEPSRLPLNTVFPSGENAIAVTQSVCPPSI